ncbi:MAG: 2-dehydropantoate 2-reductase [Deltaproteobacteria bacterium]|nr:2-dehydropantoate 2-reductase [Deltaproteobacteria bacterium]
MKVAVLGPGALGCLMAALFREAGADVSLVDYRPERVARLRLQGIQVHTLEGGRLVIKAPIGLGPEVGPCDLTIVAVKAYQTETAARTLPGLMSQGGMALTLQNGLGNLESIARIVGPERLLAGVGLLGVTRQDEGRIIYAGRGIIYIGAPSGSRVSRGEVAAVVNLFRRAGLSCQPREDIQAVLWEKLVINVGINPLTALLRVPNGVLLQLPEAWEVAVAAAQEAQTVAQAAGITLSGDPAARLRQVCTDTAANRSSMLQDILAGRPTEIEALNAQVATQGRALGLPTPVNDLLTRLLRAAAQSAPFKVG